ncbi:uncharacterized protein LOC114742579 isoform X2 [Neltuma alba]|uniref:uncharacterized protein LOC114742579 isoform X2 n=1 Tax=Neltuma alba TaxID=207710 RepID=UPI0010A40F66|nr:uncharacterized protein LOC114742579 isoform X2 [Prosopis alba]
MQMKPIRTFTEVAAPITLSSFLPSSSSSSFQFKLIIRGPKGAIQEIDEEEEEAEEDDDDNEEDEEDDDLLQLKLGSGSATTLCRKRVGNNNGESNPVVPRSGSLGLGLGLKLWPNMEQESSEMAGVEEVARRFIGRLPSWQMDPQDWYKPSPPAHNSHHFSHTNPHHSGLWFTLHSSTNQGEALPQVPKAYIRVKNENMTIFMVKKYLVTKLGLFNENEVEILCMGQRLLNVQSLKVVRDAIWIPALVDSLNAASSISSSLADSSCGMSAPNLMPLLYQKYIISNNSNHL